MTDARTPKDQGRRPWVRLPPPLPRRPPPLPAPPAPAAPLRPTATPVPVVAPPALPPPVPLAAPTLPPATLLAAPLALPRPRADRDEGGIHPYCSTEAPDTEALLALLTLLMTLLLELALAAATSLRWLAGPVRRGRTVSREARGACGGVGGRHSTDTTPVDAVSTLPRLQLARRPLLAPVRPPR